MELKRVTSVDALRGLVMILMAIDHTRDFFTSVRFQPDDLRQTTAALFFTRWITHFCAPVFMFTAGIGAFLLLQRGRTVGQVSRFLWTRGLWLVFLELTVLRFGFTFHLFSGVVLLTVLWALGWSMVALSLLIRIPVPVLAPLSIAVIALHNLTDKVTPAAFGSAGWIWNILHRPGVFPVLGTPVLAAYPLVPWIFVMAAGFCFGTVFTLEPAVRRRRIFQLGLATTLAFLAIRGVDIYGDPFHRTAGLLAFLRVTKYPPSLDFLLMTLGPAMMLLAWLDGRTFSARNPLMVFGRVPLFYFLLHFFLIHLLMYPFALLQFGHAEFVASAPGDTNFPGWGYSLPVIYAIWLAVVVACYPVCLWFARLKERRRDWWLSYL